MPRLPAAEVGRIPPGVEGLAQEGIAAFNRGEFRRAVSAFTRAIRLEPRASLLAFRAMAHRSAGRLREAAADIAAAVRAEPRSADLRVRAAQLLLDLGRTKEALAQASFAAELDPRSSAARELQARCARSQDRRGRAPARKARRPKRKGVDRTALHLRRAHVLLGRERAREALEHCRRAAALDPARAAAWELESVCEAALGLKAEAWESLRRALTLEPGRAAWRLRAARLLLDLGDPDSALEQCTRAQKSEPGGAAAWALQSSIEQTLGRKDAARRSLEFAIARAPRDAGLRAASAVLLEEGGRFEDAFARLKKAVALDSRCAKALSGLSRQLLWRGRYPEALAAARRAAALEPSTSLAFRVRGAALLLLGKAREAVAPLSEAVALDSKDIEARIWRAEAYRTLGRNAHALRDLETARLTWPVAVGALANFLLIKTGDDEQAFLRSAEPFFARHGAAGPREALRFMGGSRANDFVYAEKGRLKRYRRPSDREALAAIQDKMTLGDPGAVMRDFAEIQRKRPSDPQVHSYRGEVFLWLGDHRRARRELERALRMDPKTRWPYVGLAAVSLLQGDPRGALTRLETAKQKVNAAPSVYGHWRGEALRRCGRLKEALIELKRAVSISDRPSSQINLALAYGALKDDLRQREVFHRLKRRSYSFMRDAASAAGADLEEEGRGSMGRILEKALELMRGNRSSRVHTYFAGGRLKTIHAVQA